VNSDRANGFMLTPFLAGANMQAPHRGAPNGAVVQG
jgi:hypothetical protein